MLWIFLLLQKTARAMLPGFIWKPNRCERCGCDYYYRMDRVGNGNHTTYGGDQFAAQQAADWAARSDLDRKLRDDADPVPCPDCGLYQQSMVRVMRERRFPKPGTTMWTLCIVFGSILALVGVIVFAAMGAEDSHSYNRGGGAGYSSSSYSSSGYGTPPKRVDDTDQVVRWAVSLLVGLAGVGLCFVPVIRGSVQRRKREALDPNRPGAPAEDWQAPPALRRVDFERLMAQEQAAQQAAQHAAWQQWQAQQAAWQQQQAGWQQPPPAAGYPHPQQAYPAAPRR